MVTIEQIKELREQTGISISECKKALEQAQGDFDKAREVLRAWGKEVAAKKQARSVAEGMIEVYAHPTGKVGVLVDVGCETDFVARAEDFKVLTKEIAMQVAAMNPESVEDLLAQPYMRDSGKTIKNLIEEAVAKLGENIVVQRFSRFQI